MKKLNLLFLAVLVPLISFAHNVVDVFAEGTRWECIFNSPIPYEPDPRLGTYILQGETEFLGKKCLKMWRYMNDDKENTLQLEAYIRVEGTKVYFVDNDDAKEWLLLYNFANAENEDEIFTIYLPSEGWNKGSDDKKLSFNLQLSDYFLATDRYPLYVITLYNAFHDDYVETQAAYWINDVGSMCGPMYPLLPFYVQGSSHPTLARVWRGHELLYENQAVSVDSVVNPDADIRVLGRTLTMSTPQENSAVSIAHIDGRIVSTLKVGAEPMSVELPSAGIYLVSINGKTTKIVAN